MLAFVGCDVKTQTTIAFQPKETVADRKEQSLSGRCATDRSVLLVNAPDTNNPFSEVFVFVFSLVSKRPIIDGYRTFKDFEMNEDRLTELLNQAQYMIEKKFLQKVYPDLNLTPDHAQELCAQYMIDKYHDMPVTIPDFAFPDMQIAIYCDGSAHENNPKAFSMDRFSVKGVAVAGLDCVAFFGVPDR